MDEGGYERQDFGLDNPASEDYYDDIEMTYDSTLSKETIPKSSQVSGIGTISPISGP